MTPSCSLVARLRSSVATYVRRDEGSATLWSLMMMMLVMGIGGLAVDYTNGWRIKTGMQSTADVAALAGAWDLPEPYLQLTYPEVDKAIIRQSAENFAWRNMQKRYHGNYIIPDNDVRIGHWYPSIRKFVEGGEPVNAVHVWLDRNDERENSVPTMMLRIAGLWKYDVAAQAVAHFGVLSCHTQGLIARETLKITPNASIMGPTCLHGQLGVDMRPNIEYWSDEIDGMITTGTAPSAYTKDRWKVSDGIDAETGEPIVFGDEPQNPETGNLYPLMVDGVPTIGKGMIMNWTHYQHFAFPRTENALNYVAQGGKFIAMPNNFTNFNGTQTQTTDSGFAPTDFGWLDSGIEVASLDGFSSLGALLGLSAKSGGSIEWPTEGGEVAGIPTFEYLDGKYNYNNYQFPEDKTKLNSTTLSGYLATSALYPSGVESAPIVPEQRYFIEKCKSDTLTLSGVIMDVTIVTNCKLVIDTDAHVYNSVLLTTAGIDGSESGIQVKNGAVVGLPTSCQDYGGVRMYSGGDITVTGSGNKFNDDGDPDDVSTSQFWGVQMVARKDIHFAGKGDAEKGITMHAGGEIHLSAQAEIAGLELDVSEEDTETMGNCPEGVGDAYESSAYVPVLVH